jgi:hypothetical protein
MKEEILNHHSKRKVRREITIIEQQIEDLDMFEKKVVAWPCKK